MQVELSSFFKVPCHAAGSGFVRRDMMLHQEMTQFVRDRETCPWVPRAGVGEDDAVKPQSICQQHSFKAVEPVEADCETTSAKAFCTDGIGPLIWPRARGILLAICAGWWRSERSTRFRF